MNIGIYGLGRFGFLWARILSQKFQVYAYSRNPNRKSPPGIPRVSENDILKCDTIFLCVSISAVDTVLQNISDRIGPDTLIADTSSVKVYPLECMKQRLPEQIEVMGTHPMFGPDSAKDGTKGLPIVVNTDSRAKSTTIDYWKNIFTQFGMQVLSMSSHEHDQEAAYTQGITHFVGRVLGDLHLKESRIATLGYKKLLEIIEQTCNDPWQLFSDLQNYNPYTHDMRNDLKKSFEKIFSNFHSAVNEEHIIDSNSKCDI